ncbi:L,D-transpeptidase [Levilactobacillus brevis]|uniref:L,D-transpeptidase n=1 Tax=Levilactobacillus brevis TaxID=1580 RepID=A0AAJ5FJZ4_LEVBR|nr:L,D-transpeptidase [Levilactobacillus brevis]AWP47112.1 L,D-transpeptidase [Levilactobacillus brevis]RAY10389.1 L,D-transpeptidase [Levilactobacillus brevis]TOZ05073.1 L,D-transpeptidase [Levilactobacillus brevis]
MRRFRRLLVIVVLIVAVAAGINRVIQKSSADDATQSTAQPTTKKKTTTTKAKTINWRQPSENKAYPNLKQHPDAWLDVNTSKQRVYIRHGQQILYTMYCSTGVGKNKTPHGTYHIQAERGKFFYNQGSGEGARYWVSWKDHGIYLFHSVPTDADGNYIKKEAEELGKTAASHGCVRLSVADAKWVYNHVPYGMKVVIHD